MSKKTVLILASIAIIVGGGTTGYFLLSKRQEASSQVSLPATQEESESSENLLYQDSSGFTFRYPKGLTVTDVTPGNYYSLLNISKGNEKITITVKDGKASDISYPGATTIGTVSLDNISAREYKKEGKLITAGIDNGIVYVIEGPADGGFWENVQKTIVSSFTLTESGQSASLGGQGDITEEEQVVQ